MGTGISSLLLRSFPFHAEWLVRISYIYFALVCMLFITLQVVSVAQLVQSSLNHGLRKHYYYNTFKNMDNNVFWGTYAMGLQTIINYLFEIATSSSVVNTASATRLMYVVYILWWYDLTSSMFIAWGITFSIWKGHYITEFHPHDSKATKMMRENLQTVLLLPVITLVVASSGSSIFASTDLFIQTFGRNIQLMTLTVTFIVWLHAIGFVAIILSIYAWNLYVNKLPQVNKVFSVFLCLGPMGQGAFGILLLTDDIFKYILKYYPIDSNSDPKDYVVTLSVAWFFRIFGLIASLTLLAAGFFFTLLCVFTILSFSREHKKAVFTYQKAWWSMTFPLGTMALGTHELYLQFNPYVPLITFKAISSIYATFCILITTACLFGTAYQLVPTWYSFFVENISRNTTSYDRKLENSTDDNCTV